MKKVELLSPAGDFASLRAAVENGADAVYFGVPKLNMRAAAKNFSLSEIKKVVKYCHKNKVKAYLTLNTIIYDNEIKTAEKILKKAKEAKVDAVIAWDFAIIQLCKKLKLKIHLSTQANVTNSEEIKFYKKLGIKRINLARELNLKQIKKIKKQNIEIEVFAHGALCVSISGRCFISQSLYKKSANRGECLQPCRREYEIKDKETGFKLKLGNNYILSPKDLCVLPILDKMIEAKIDALKIEGRNRSPEYVAIATKAYREAIDAYYKKKLTKNLINKLLKKLKTVYNRGFSTNFYLGIPDKKTYTDRYGSKAAKKKVYLGYIKKFYKNINVAEIKIEANSVKVGDSLLIIGNKTGVKEEKVKSMEINHKKVKNAKKGQRVAVKFKNEVRENDKVYLF
jgi:U32 family peptidase